MMCAHISPNSTGERVSLLHSPDQGCRRCHNIPISIHDKLLYWHHVKHGDKTAVTLCIVQYASALVWWVYLQALRECGMKELADEAQERLREEYAL